MLEISFVWLVLLPFVLRLAAETMKMTLPGVVTGLLMYTGCLLQEDWMLFLEWLVLLVLLPLLLLLLCWQVLLLPLHLLMAALRGGGLKMQHIKIGL